MNILNVLKIVAIILAVVTSLWILKGYHNEKLTHIERIKIAGIGFIANFFDTIGVGSFAIIIALSKLLRVMPDEVKLIGSMNIEAVIISTVQALIFLHFIHMDLITLAISVVMVSLGGFLSGSIAVRVNRRVVHKVMLFAFIFTGIILLLTQLNLLHIAGDSYSMRGSRLIIFAIFMLIAGALPAFGVGFYAIITAGIFLLGVNPVIAFPIMTLSSAYQSPLTALPFINKQKFYTKSIIILSIFGIFGVCIAAPLISTINSHALKWILLVVIIYNVIVLAKSSKK